LKGFDKLKLKAKKAISEPTSWQKWIFVIWMIAGPLYLFLDWMWNWAQQETDPIKRFQQTQKLLTDLWTASAVVFGVFWGLKK